MTPNPWEEKMRARKAYLVARVLLHLVEDSEDVSVDDLVGVDEAFRDRVGKLAQTKSLPSKKTWGIAVEIVRAELDRRAGPDPFTAPTPG